MAKHEAFLKRLEQNGGELLALSNNPWELLRFRTKFGVGVVYANRRGEETWNREAQLARDALSGGFIENVSPAPVSKYKAKAGEIPRLLERDGPNCFYCLEPFESDKPGRMATREHLIGRNHGGPNHLGNKVLAHQVCNNRVGHLSLPEKLKVREAALKATWAVERQGEPA